jgi:hypothetical protein
MDPETPSPPASPSDQPQPSAKRGPGNGVRLGALAALAVAGGLLAWVIVDRSDDDSGAPATPATTVEAALPATPADPVGQPAIRTIAELRAAAAQSALPIYWAGARAGTRLEVSETSGGTVFVRYLPSGSAAGDLQPHLTVATYARPNGFTEVQAAAKNDGSRSIELDDGGLAVYDLASPTNVHLAFPDEEHQIEVFSPTAGEALRLVENGKITPVP